MLFRSLEQDPTVVSARSADRGPHGAVVRGWTGARAPGLDRAAALLKIRFEASDRLACFPTNCPDWAQMQWEIMGGR